MFNLFRSSVVGKVVGISLGLIAASIILLVVVAGYFLRANVLEQAQMDARDASRTMAMIYGAKVPDAKILLEQDNLHSITLESVAGLPDFEVVDRTAQSIGGVATLFEKQGSDYVRVSTNVKKENGERAIGTKLASDHPAQTVLARGEAYYGRATLFGKEFMTGYYPVKNAAGANVGVLFVGLPMQAYFDQVSYLEAIVVGSGIAVLIGVGIIAYLLIHGSIRPLRTMTAAVRAISSGNLTAAIPDLDKRNEFGDIARALEVFRDNARAKQDIELVASAERAASEAQRQGHEADRQEVDRQIGFAVEQLAAGLGKLAQGDLTCGIDTPFTGRLEQLRVDFNTSVVRLHDTLSRIRGNTLSIQRNGNEMSQSALQLAKRTETQASSLEETAAAVDEITVTVRSSAERAREANEAVVATKTHADNSGAVVGNAIAAMHRIEDASKKIEQIIEVIDDIAFQTNLLALNAGIEAARAGEAGKGFAVVAQEVRELAQRSAGAAREIKDLIDTSTQEVAGGSSLVLETGRVLSTISEQIVAVSQHVSTIATASRDQSAALQNVNSSVNAMDQMTQQNAAMVEETTVASRLLADEADALMHLVDQFRMHSGAGANAMRRAA